MSLRRRKRRSIKLKRDRINTVRSTRFEVPTDKLEKRIGKTPEEAIKRAWKEIDRLGYTIIRKKRGNFTTTFKNILFLDDHYEKMGPIDKASLLWHEIEVHAEQWRAWGWWRFAYRYTRPDWRWAIEVPAYRHQYRVWLYFGIPESKIRKSISKLPDNFINNYRMKRLDKNQMIKETNIAMQRGLGIKL